MLTGYRICQTRPFLSSLAKKNGNATSRDAFPLKTETPRIRSNLNRNFFDPLSNQKIIGSISSTAVHYEKGTFALFVEQIVFRLFFAFICFLFFAEPFPIGVVKSPKNRSLIFEHAFIIKSLRGGRERICFDQCAKIAVVQMDRLVTRHHRDCLSVPPLFQQPPWVKSNKAHIATRVPVPWVHLCVFPRIFVPEKF